MAYASGAGYYPRCITKLYFKKALLNGWAPRCTIPLRAFDYKQSTQQFYQQKHVYHSQLRGGKLFSRLY
jgi:hypothetical protein